MRCKHTGLSSNKRTDFSLIFTCDECGNNCKFCGACGEPYTEKTINKYNGLCGQCFSACKDEDTIFEEDDLGSPQEYGLNVPSLPNFGNMGQMMIFIGANPRDFDNGSCSSDDDDRDNKPERKKKKGIPISTLYQPLDDNKFEKGKFTVKSILAKDDIAKKVLVEWKDDNVATWETFDSLKKNEIFSEYLKLNKKK